MTIDVSEGIQCAISSNENNYQQALHQLRSDSNGNSQYYMSVNNVQ